MGPLARLTVLLAAAFPALVASDTPSSLPHITNISFSGNGCAKDPGFSGGFSDPSITYNSFSARYPGETQTVNCEVHIQASGASPGWQVALKDNWVRGRVALGPGTSLTYYTSVYFSQDAARTDSVRGTVNNNGGDILRQDVTLHSELRNKAWSPCTGSDGYTGILNINFRGALTGDGSWATFEAYNQNWDLEWRRC
ncbi:hypothetical protein B0H67DRAFT_548810 [Lasiosphaeris hirsuta]|uniref:Secreted protein n=1 Tax=Lasiosphaeris hirsuta TaxID=260670 RepID=A0AA40ED43_9PEZI|nr:hypothetical protein B0H67DRAFT_548810 [Lasiosphaeris hirsuta]